MIELMFLLEVFLFRSDVIKTSESKVWYLSLSVFFKGFNFQPYVCNICHDLLMSMNLTDTVILKIENTDYSCITTGISTC